MGLSATVKEWYIKTLPGMNNLVEDLDLKDKWVETAQNCRFEEEPGAVDKREPVTYYNSSTASIGAGAYGVAGLERFYTSGGTSKFVCVHNTGAFVGADATGTWASIRTGLTAGKRCSFVTYKDLLIASNGFDNPWVYDGSSDNVTWELGSCKATAETATGSIVATGSAHTYQVGITVSGATHLCGAMSTATTSSSGSIALSNIPLGPPGTTDRVIYRTNAGSATAQGNFYHIYTVPDNSTVAYTDTAGVTTGTAVAAVNNNMPVGTKLKIHRERLFMTGDPSNPNKIPYSDPWLPHFISITTNTSYMDISPEDGDEISDIPIQLGTMVCIKKNTIRKLHITSAQSGADPTTWYADDPVSWNGSPAPWSITQTPYGIVYLGWDHWYLFDGAGSRPIIDEFDVKDILPSGYEDVVGFYHKGIMLAAYPDKDIANQFHDRIMRWNFKRKTLGYDVWTGTNIVGANCFAAKTGDDETGELYYGDSQKAYVLKDKESEEAYRLRTKAEINEGSFLVGGTGTASVFVGGTEASPFLEVGGVTSASNIPDGVVIFWDSDSTTPGSGWGEITSTYSGAIVKIASASATGAASTHSHTISGSLSSYTPGTVNTGNQVHYNGLLSGHSHSYSVTSSTASVEPRHIRLRMFESSSCATDEFPDGAIVMWDQETAPTGWQSLSNVGYYVKVAATNLNSPTTTSHTHTYSGTSSSGPADPGAGTNGVQPAAYNTHTHTFSNTTNSQSVDTWELDNAQLHMIKKIGEADTWDGSDQKVLCLVTGASTPTGWTNVDTYNDKYLKVGAAAASTGAAASASHTHSTPADTSATQSQTYGSSESSRTYCRKSHTHSIGATSTNAGSATAPKTVSLRLFSFVLGKMKDYNAAMVTAATGGTWTSPTMKINAFTLAEMFWNETLTGTDNAVFEFHTGATSNACTAAAYGTVMTNPNGSSIDSTADVWAQYRIVFTCADSTVSNPRIYFTDGHLVKYTYFIGATNAETSVNWLYNIGFRNFDSPFLDKVFKKITTVHKGEDGSFTVEWETENTSTDNTFVVDLTNDGARWDSFFPSTAMGKKINFSFYKNDLYDFRLSEVKGLYTPMPILI